MWTYAEVLIFTGLWFIVGLFLWLAMALLFVRFVVVARILHRFGELQGLKAWLSLIAGVDPLRQYMDATVRSLNADEAWDEFACAALHVHQQFEESDRLANKTLVALGTLPPVNSSAHQKLEYDEAVCLVRDALVVPVQQLAARLSLTRLNFTVWRVHPTLDKLEHLASFPSDSGVGAGYPRRRMLAIWTTPGRSQMGSFGAKVMHEGEYEILHERDLPDNWERRQLGRAYQEVAAMPIPCDGAGSLKWGVVCVEARDGAIPLNSKAMRLLVGQITRIIDHARPYVAVRGIKEGQIVPITTPSDTEAAGAKG